MPKRAPSRSTKATTGMKPTKRSPVPDHALPFAMRFKELIDTRWCSTTALAKHIGVTQSMLSKITHGKVPMDEAWLTGEARSLHGGADNRAKSTKPINILDALRLKGEEREDFKVAGLLAIGPAALQEIVKGYRKELVALRTRSRNR